MGDSSDGTDNEDMEWLIAEYKKRKRSKKEITDEDISRIIGIDQTSKTHKLNTPTKQTSKNSTEITIQQTNKNIQKTMTRNYSSIMNEIRNQVFKYLYYINTEDTKTRIEMADDWEKEFPNSRDVILKTKKGFLLKSNTDKYQLITKLSNLRDNKKITNFKETSPASRQDNANLPQPTYSAIISSVELYIEDKDVGEHLLKQNIMHRFCKRIISKATNNPTMKIRVITGCPNAFAKLLNEGVFYKNRHYPVFPSNPPPPAPIPCKRCSQFDHTSDQCNNPIKCDKCSGNHHPLKCTTQLPPKCLACGAEDHKAWSMKCPKRPTQAIEGIPNTKIKSLNKKTHQMDKKNTEHNRIHSSISIHDLIINTYVTKINKPKNINREELLQKLKQRFVQLYNIETAAAFCGNRMYILMYDLENPQDTSPTETIQNVNNIQIHVAS